MYAVMLVDDEKIVLQGIQKVFHMEDYGFHIVGAFSNPVKALESIQELKPDLIITDLKMPQMDGLEFSTRVRELLPDTEIVILSGYDEFASAQHALKLGISDYLLKPIKKADFASMLRTMHDSIERKNGRAAYYESLQQYAEHNTMELKNQFFLNLAEKGKYEEGYVRAFCEKMHLPLENAYYVLVKVVIDDLHTSEDYMSAIGKLSEKFQEKMEAYGNVEMFLSDEELYFVVYRSDEDIPVPEIKETASKFKEKLQETNVSVYIGCSSPVHGLERLFVARNECDDQILVGRENMSSGDKTGPRLIGMDVSIPYSDMEALFAAISVNDREQITKSIERIYSLPVNALYRDFCTSLTFIILLRLGHMMSRYKQNRFGFPVDALDMKVLRKEYPTVLQQKEFIGKTAFMLADLIDTKEMASPKKIVRDALNYIREHYNENISLTDVSRHINISKNYLCDIFKKELNITFINYVTALRIEKAKELLVTTDMKMYEISAAVGYNDYAYFSQIFKRQTGVTLSAWRRQN